LSLSAWPRLLRRWFRSARDRGDLARDRQRWTDAARHYRTHLHRHPQDFAIWVQLGHSLKEAGRIGEAIDAYRAGLAIDGDDADLLLHLRHLYQDHPPQRIGQGPAIIFLFNLLQDVGVARPLVYLAAEEFVAEICLLVSGEFLERDTTGLWIGELERMCRDTGATLTIQPTPERACGCLQGRSGVLIAASESNLEPHRYTHALFRSAPAGFTRITLQHGFECVGFLHNRDQSAAYGDHVFFAADVLCGWAEAEALTAMSATERAKLRVTGPTLALHERAGRAGGNGGLVCENLHSVRFGAANGRRDAFMEDVAAVSAILAERGEALTLRAHPGGRYFAEHGLAPPRGARTENRPLYKVDLAGFDYGISAPSTVLLDMMLAGLPVAVWNDPESPIDVSHYVGLHQVAGADEWLAFQQAVLQDPDAFLRQQADFLGRTGLLLDPTTVRTRFISVLTEACNLITARDQ